ncbi:F-box/LRR-repeat protein 17-like [Actinia tenebrosa]|uniref:F-box/LRR-repeat protein 17-like n=1 Tax=Actinia tenebrosa TaxID=6105 RepID=A0A6P8IKN0_ACTTE|nr:F-box/LRR-repeat protein 17-like [Actinia tenebrosa]
MAVDVVGKSLPDAILLEMFRYLSRRELGRVALVNRQWRRIAYDPSLWRTVDLTELFPHTMGDEKTLLMLLRTRLASARSLNMAECSLTPDLAKELSRKQDTLKSLVRFGVRGNIRDFPNGLELMDLRYSWGDFSFMRRLPRHFSKIKCIGLGSVSSEFLIPDIFTKMRHLRVLELTDCSALTDDTMVKISLSCPHLESICLNECKNFHGKCLSRVLDNCPMITTLLIRFTKMTDSALISVNWEKTRVQELDLTGCYFVTTTGLSNVISRLPNLHYLKMNQCGFRHILHLTVYQEIRPNVKYTNLETLDLRWNFLLSAECLEGILRQAPNLRYLGVSHSPRVPPSVLASLLKYVPNLRVLEFGPLRKESLSESKLVPTLINSCQVIEAVSLINFKVMDKDDTLLLQELREKCKHIKEVKLCNPRIEHVAIGNQGETITVERLLIKMDSQLPSPKNTLGRKILMSHK